MHGVNKEVCWGVGGGQGSCGKRYGGCGGDVGKCDGVWGEVRKDMWGSVLASGERMWGG